MSTNKRCISTDNGLYNAVMPVTNKIVIMQLPRILPITMSYSFLNMPTRQTTNSGNDVPIAMSVNPMIASLAPTAFAISAPVVTTIFAPKNTAATPTIKTNTVRKNGTTPEANSFENSSSTFFDSLNIVFFHVYARNNKKNKSINNPSIFPIMYVALPKSNNLNDKTNKITDARSKNGASNNTVNDSTTNGEIIAIIPNTNPIVVIELPIILPNAISGLPTYAL